MTALVCQKWPQKNPGTIPVKSYGGASLDSNKRSKKRLQRSDRELNAMSIICQLRTST